MSALLDFLNSMDPAARAAFAQRCGTSLGYLRKAISTKQRLGECLALAIERESAGAVSVVALRPDLAAEMAAAGYLKQEPNATESHEAA